MKALRGGTLIGFVLGRRRLCGLIAAAWMAAVPASTENAVANGDTRTLNLYHAHTHESIAATYLVDGQYDQSVLDKLNWFLRDWRRDEPTKMDPRLFDVVWEVHRESGSRQPIEVMSAYRSPETNAMLRRRSRGVAEHSQHILGKAMDQHYMDVPMSRIRELGMRLQRGGVGFYPTAGTPFVHLDVGGVRHWPRMSYDQLARLFPDGKTVHIPSNGQPLAHYEEARAELEAHGDGSYPTASQLTSKGFFAWLFGGGGGDEEEDNAAAGIKGRRGAPAPSARTASAGIRDTSAELDVGHYGKAAQDRVSVASYGTAPQLSFFAAKPSAPPPAPPAAASPADLPRPAETVSDQPAPPAVPAAAPPSPRLLDVPAAADAATGGARLGGGADARLGPLPPRRPTELAVLGPAPPLPPARPTALPAGAPHDLAPAKVDPIGSLLAVSSGRGAGLPDVITQRGTGPGTRVLGYAPQPGPDAVVPMPVARPTDLLSTRLDRSNFRALTRPEAMDGKGGRSTLGAALPPLRAAVRADLGALDADAAGRAAIFQARASDLTTNRFSGSLLRPDSQGRGAARGTAVE